MEPDMDDMENISPERMTELKDCFRTFDRDGSGTISMTEFQSALMNNGIYVEDSEIKRLIMEFDDDGSLTLDFEEFVSLIAQLDPKIGQDIEINKGFKLFDKDQDGYITRYEVKFALDRFGVKISKEDFEFLFSCTDANNDGLISQEEFRNVLYDPNQKAVKTFEVVEEENPEEEEQELRDAEAAMGAIQSDKAAAAAATAARRTK